MEDLDVTATRNIKEQMEKIEFLFSKFINGKLFLKRKENKAKNAYFCTNKNQDVI